MSSAALRLGLVSTANINGQILAAAAASERVTAVAVGSRDAGRAEAYAREHGLDRSYGSYEALLRDPGIDAVYISLPNSLHHEWTMRGLEAGKHVLCEKPYSRQPAEVEEAYAAAARAGLVLMEAFMYRHHPQTHTIERLLREGAVGRLRAVKATFTFPLRDMSDVRALPALGGGALMDVGCYCVSSSRLLAGEPLSFSAETITGSTGIDMALFGTMRFANDVVAQFESSFLAPTRQRLEVVGDEAVLVAESPFRIDWPGALTLERGVETEILVVPEGNSYQLQLENLADAIAGTGPALLGRSDAFGQARAIDALYRSAAVGRAVTA